MYIIEDCSPYYIRFKHDNVQNIIDYCSGKLPAGIFNTGFNHYKLTTAEALKLLPLLPCSKHMQLKLNRFSLFITEPGRYYGAHKDGYPRCMFSINYPIIIQDDKCLTSWYNEEDIINSGYVINRNTAHNLGFNVAKYTGDSREVQNFDKSKHIPVKTMTAKIGEGILFNTDIFHDWDNTTSINRRVVLTLRHINSDKVSFNDAKKIMFNL